MEAKLYFKLGNRENKLTGTDQSKTNDIGRTECYKRTVNEGLEMTQEPLQ